MLPIPPENRPGAISLSVMLSWPNTPGQETMDRLRPIFHDKDRPFHYEAATKTSPPDLTPHIEAYVERLTVNAFQEDALQFYAELKREFPNESPIETIRQAASIGSTNQTIGMGIMTDDPGIPQSSPVPGMNTIMFTRLSRDPRWMGMDSNLPYLRHLQAIVFQDTAKDTPIPHLIIAIPRDVEIEGDTTSAFPQGIATELARLLAWHGATPRLWIVQ